ncbi:MAG: hypothetical protein ACRD5H_03055 [Nitrososphaerales archaeon]
MAALDEFASDQTIDRMKEMAKSLTERFTEYFNDCEAIKKELETADSDLKRNRLLLAHLSRKQEMIIFGVLGLNTAIVANMLSAIQSLPKRKEYDDLKLVIDSQGQKVIDTLVPLKEAMERAEEKSDRGDGIYV